MDLEVLVETRVSWGIGRALVGLARDSREGWEGVRGPTVAGNVGGASRFKRCLSANHHPTYHALPCRCIRGDMQAAHRK